MGEKLKQMIVKNYGDSKIVLSLKGDLTCWDLIELFWAGTK